MGRMGQDLGVKSNLKTGMKLKARKMQNLKFENMTNASVLSEKKLPLAEVRKCGRGLF